MVSLLRYVAGYVEFCAEGGFPERFLNLCKVHGISLWKIKSDGVKVNACTTAGEFKKIETPAENSGMKVSVIKNKGLPCFLKRYRWRCGALFGVFVTIAFIWFMSGFIWEVEVVEEGVRLENFTQNLDNLGVKSGARKSEIDILEVQERLLEMYPQLSWVSLNIFGDKAQIEYTPAKEMPMTSDGNEASNIVASKSGKITLVEGYKGTNVVKEGAFVAKGSLLISGVTVNSDGSEKFTSASGKVFARTENYIKEQTPTEFESFVSEGSSKRYTLNIFGLKIPFGFSFDGDIVTSATVSLEADSAVLPVGVTREDGIFLHEEKVGLSEDEAKLVCLKRCIEKKRSEFEKTQLEKISFSAAKNAGTVTVTAKIVCIENIATEVPLAVE